MARKLAWGCLILLIWAGLYTPALAERIPVRAVALSGSLADAWRLAGGVLVGATDDAGMPELASVGGTQSPSLEAIVLLSPDWVIGSSAQSGHMALQAPLEAMGIGVKLLNVNDYRAYLDMMRALCDLTGDEAAYRAQEDAVRAPIEEIIARRADRGTLLLLRAYAGGVKAKGSDNLAGAMLKDMGYVNLADGEAGVLEDITLEHIVAADPETIFVTTMGDDAAALLAIQTLFADNPAWAGLRAVRDGRYHVLPKELFHLKPNARWAEAYRYLEALDP